MIDPAYFAPVGGAIGGAAAWAAFYWSRRKERATKRFLDALQQDEILGHKNVPGVPDKRSISERLGTMEIATQQMAKELHPNGGTSMLDTVNATHKLATEAAAGASEAARVLAEREKLRVAGEALLRSRIRQNPDLRELNQLLDVLPPPTEGT